MSLKKIDFHNGCPYQTSEGLFYYVADVEPVLNSLQQLQAKIAALAKQLEAAKSNGLDSRQVVFLIQDLRQLSAVQ